MKLRLDEHYSPRIAELLRAGGHDVVAVVARPDLAGLTDRSLIAMAHDEGRALVTEFTDLANPTSNHIYQMIGYEPVRDVDVYRFDRRG